MKHCTLASLLMLAAAPALALDIPALERELLAVETSFAQTMADRDHEAFTTFLADEVIFASGDSRMTGRGAVAAGWAPFFEGEDAPFSWKPDFVSVLATGDLGLTSGPVFDAAGERVGTFNSVWRRTEDGWRIVLDRGCD